MNDTQTDKYHDAHGRPLPPAAPEPSKTSRETLQAWQCATLARAADRQERRAAYKELGPLHAQPSTVKTQRREQLAAALGVQTDTAAEAKATINAAFPLALPPPAGEPEQPPAAPIGAANSPNQRTVAQETPQPALAPELGPPPPDPTAETERRMANIKASEERTSARSAARRAASLKSAATVRARRAKSEHDAEVNRMTEKPLDRIGERIIREQAAANADTAQAEADPGIPTYRSILGTARDAGPDAEAELYRLAHLARATRKPADWPAALRSSLAASLMTYIANRKPPTPKGPRK